MTVKTLDLGTVQPKQELFMLSRAKYTAFGGARGGGKSWAVRAKAVLMCMQKELAGIKILIVRKTYQELMNNHINELRGLLYGIAKYNGSEKIFRFPNGSTIKFDYCAADGDVDHYQGVEYDVIFLDEAGQLREDWIKKIIASMRGANNLPKRTYFTLNPGGPSHGYFKRIFVDRAFNDTENPDDYAFIQSKVYDNIILMERQPDYIQQLKSLPRKLREAWLEGDWNMFTGQFFEEFVDEPEHYDDWQYTHVINPFDPPREWGDIYRSYDEGYNAPFSVQWFTVNPDGVLFLIMELYGCAEQPNEGVKWTNDEVFARVSEIERSHPWFKGRQIHGVADPACWAGSERGISSMDMAARYGLHFKKADNARVPGWMQVRYRFQFDKNGYARLYFFNTCKHMIRTIRLQMFDDKKPDDLDSSLEDHAADSLRYMCQSRIVAPILKEPEAPPLFNPLASDNELRRRA